MNHVVVHRCERCPLCASDDYGTVCSHPSADQRLPEAVPGRFVASADDVPPEERDLVHDTLGGGPYRASFSPIPPWCPLCGEPLTIALEGGAHRGQPA